MKKYSDYKSILRPISSKELAILTQKAATDILKHKVRYLTDSEEKAQAFVDRVHESNLDGCFKLIAAGHNFDSAMEHYGDGHKRNMNDLDYECQANAAIIAAFENRKPLTLKQ